MRVRVGFFLVGEVKGNRKPQSDCVRSGSTSMAGGTKESSFLRGQDDMGVSGGTEGTGGGGGGAEREEDGAIDEGAAEFQSTVSEW